MEIEKKRGKKREKEEKVVNARPEAGK